MQTGHVGACEAMGRYFERRGSRWEDGVTKKAEEDKNNNNNEMGAYFVLKVASAGWHSAALVLVDEDKAEAARTSHHHLARRRSPSPSPAPSIQSVDSQGFAYEVIHSPGEQLMIGIQSVGQWVWDAGRWFLGLTARDEARGVLQAGDGKEEGGRSRPGEAAQGTVYEWSNEPFPRLRMEDGEVMPGEIEVTE